MLAADPHISVLSLKIFYRLAAAKVAYGASYHKDLHLHDQTQVCAFAEQDFGELINLQHGPDALRNFLKWSFYFDTPVYGDDGALISIDSAEKERAYIKEMFS
jgi:hypothetical protein